MRLVPISRRRGISLIEVLVVIGIIGLLLALMLPAIQSSRQTARKVSCLKNLQQIGLALHNYHDQHNLFPPAVVWAGPDGEPLGRGRMPVGVIDRVALKLTNTDPDRVLANWLIMLLPALAESNLWNAYHPGLVVSDSANATVRTTSISTLKCPGDPYNSDAYDRGQVNGASNLYARGNYAMNMGPGRGCFHELDPNCVDGFHVDDPDLVRKNASLWGGGAGGVNCSFSVKDILGGTSNFVIVDEIRAGVSPADSRGSWALGFIGASLTARHGLLSDGDYGPNNQTPESDMTVGCRATVEAIGAETVQNLRMPCDLQGSPGSPEINGKATARSTHPGGVHVLAADGSAHFVSDMINPDIWFYLHSREPKPGFNSGF